MLRRRYPSLSALVLYCPPARRTLITALLLMHTSIRSAARPILTLATGTAGEANLSRILATGNSAATSRPHIDDAPIPESRHRASESVRTLREAVGAATRFG